MINSCNIDDKTMIHLVNNVDDKTMILLSNVEDKNLISSNIYKVHI